ncbi:MAG: hypothetical protein AAGG57_13615 [Pseudomonadota bacterium]
MDDGRRHERFACAPGLRLEAHEKLTQVHFDNIADRLGRLEEIMQRLEKRLWLTVYGVVAAILSQAFQSFIVTLP